MKTVAQAPCARCGVRADVGCKHRPAVGERPPSLVAQEHDLKREKYDRRDKGQGLGFHRAEIASNLHRAAELLGLAKRNDD